jgi:hypothetical protein
MPPAKPSSRKPRIAKLEAEIQDLRAQLLESDRIRASLLDDGLRLSQENEVLRHEIAELKKLREL